MLISRTPFRISFFGGGTDYPSWYMQHGGSVLATTIDKYCYLTCRYLPPFFEHRFRVVYSRIENCQTIDDIQHPSVQAILRRLDLGRGLEIHHDGDLPARSGIGSSSAFTVGLLHALYSLQGKMPDKQCLANESIHIEQNILEETVGSQDQICAAYGGFNHVNFMSNGEILVQPVTVGRNRLQHLNDHLMLFYTGIMRTASEVAGSYVTDLSKKHHQLGMMKELVDEGLNILVNHQDLTEFGKLLHEGWQIKRGLGAKVSNPQVDELYDIARNAGAVGGKLIGAGGGGFLLLFVAPEKQIDVRKRLQKLIHVPFKFEFAGSQIIFYNCHQPDYGTQERIRSTQAIEPFRELVHSTINQTGNG